MDAVPWLQRESYLGSAITGRPRLQDQPLTRAQMSKLSIIGEFWDFLRVRKKIWLAPIVAVLLLLAILIVVTEGSALAPFIYALF